MAEPGAAEPETPLARRTRLALAGLLRAAAQAAPCGAWPGPPLRCMGLDFPGPVGLAAGFDRCGELLAHAHRLGLGHVELGSWAGSPALRAPNPGRTACTAACRARALCGVSLGRHPATPWSRAEDDYLAGLAACAPWADYLTLNPGHEPPPPARFVELVAAVAAARDAAAPARRSPLPIVVKLPGAWLDAGALTRTALACVARGAGGLLISAEGAPSAAAAVQALRDVARAAPPEACLISVGGIRSAAQALARRRAGAHLVQLHRGISDHGPALIQAVNRACTNA